MNARIFEIFKLQFRPPVKILLGRWNIHNQLQTKLKIKYANEDNCGTCGEYNKNLLPIQIKYDSDTTIQNEVLDELYVYMMGSESIPDNINIKR